MTHLLSNKLIKNKLFELFGDDIPQYVFDRINDEASYFEEHHYLDFVIYLSSYLNDLVARLGQKNAFHPRQEVGYSLLLYLLGINDINPLPTFAYNHKKYGYTFDGFGLDFEIFKIKFESLKETLNLSYCKESKDIKFDNKVCHLVNHKLTSLTFKNNYVIVDLFDLSNAPYFAYNFDLEVGDEITSLLDKYTNELLNKYDVFSFQDFVKVIALSYGHDVVSANETINRVSLDEMIVSVDDLYHLLCEYVKPSTAIKACTIASSNKKISKELSEELLSNGVYKDIITFVDKCRYLYTRGGAISIAKSILKLAYVKMNDEDVKEAINV